MTAVTPGSATEQTSVPRWEWSLLLVILLVAGGLRFAFPSRLAVEHFDEGVYASNIWFGDQPGAVYPLQHLYAPPLLPALIEWGFVFFGPSNAGAMWASQVAGLLTVLLLWWLGRSWFGPVAGLTAATLCALSEVHILLSRAALTDVLLGMWWVLALVVLRRACDSGRWTQSVFGGVIVGLAWYTKYNGWMPLAITIAAVVAQGISGRGRWLQTRTALTSCLIAGSTAFVVWSPWLWSLQSQGGYSRVMANHRQYVVGFAGWGSSFHRQFEQLLALTGKWSLAALLLVYVAVWLVAWRRYRAMSGATNDAPSAEHSVADLQSARRQIRIVISWMSVSSLPLIAVISPVLAAAWLMLHPLIRCLVKTLGQSDGRQISRRGDLGYWIVLIWFAGLLLATPLYVPYLRLTLPWLLASFVGLGIVFQQVCDSALAVNTERFAVGNLVRSMTRQLVFIALISLLSFGAVPICGGSFQPGLLPLANQTEFVASARSLAKSVENGSHSGTPHEVSAVVYVYAEPGLLFQLRDSALANVAPVGSLEFVRSQVSGPRLKVYLAVGIHAKSDPQFLEQFAILKNQLRPAGTWPWHLGPLTALDEPDGDPGKLGHDPHEADSIDLYEVVGP